MSGPSPHIESFAHTLLLLSVRLALTMVVIVAIERAVSALLRARRRYVEERYGPLVRRVLSGDEAALAEIVAGPRRHRLTIAKLVMDPLIFDRDPVRIARTRAIVSALSIIPLADRYLRSWLWWRRAIAL